MIDRRKILRLWQRGDAAALVTLVRVEGSSYRRAGARLLIAANGDYAGSISGGCLEAEVIRKAQWLVRHGNPVVERYSTLFDDTADIPYGLGCGGTVDLLIEPAHTPECIALILALEQSLQTTQARIITWLPSSNEPLRREILSPNGETIFRSPGTSPIESDLFAETLTAPQRLFIFGAGDDAQPMVRLAALLGWSVTVIDGRPQWARPDRFPEAETVFTLDPGKPALKGRDFSPAISTVEPTWALAPEGHSTVPGTPHITPADAVVLMTHSYEQDRAWLTVTLPTSPRYLGLLGSRHRSALLVSEAAATLNWPLARACAGLFAPVGLDLGGDGAEAIALATIAEIQACCEGKLGVSRRMTPETVAEQIAQGGASRYLQTQCAL